MTAVTGAPSAVDLARASLTAVKNGRREEWLALFDEDSVIEDPVGPSPLDPEGKGHRGSAEIARFYDTAIAGLQGFDFEIERTCLCGDEAAVLVTFHITVPGEEQMDFRAINVYKRSPRGTLAALRSFHHGEETGS